MYIPICDIWNDFKSDTLQLPELRVFNRYPSRMSLQATAKCGLPSVEEPLNGIAQKHGAGVIITLRNVAFHKRQRKINYKIQTTDVWRFSWYIWMQISKYHGNRVQNERFFYKLRTIDALHSPVKKGIQFQPYPIHENNINLESINSLSKQQWYIVVQGIGDPYRWLNQAICQKWFQSLMLLFYVLPL